MSHKQTLSDLEIDLFTHIYVDRIKNTVNEFNMHMYALDFNRPLLAFL